MARVTIGSGNCGLCGHFSLTRDSCSACGYQTCNGGCSRGCWSGNRLRSPCYWTFLTNCPRCRVNHGDHSKDPKPPSPPAPNRTPEVAKAAATDSRPAPAAPEAPTDPSVEQAKLVGFSVLLLGGLAVLYWKVVLAVFGGIVGVIGVHALIKRRVTMPLRLVMFVSALLAGLAGTGFYLWYGWKDWRVLVGVPVAALLGFAVHAVVKRKVTGPVRVIVNGIIILAALALCGVILWLGGKLAWSILKSI